MFTIGFYNNMEIQLNFVTNVHSKHLQSLEYGVSQRALANAFYFSRVIAYIASHLRLKRCRCHPKFRSIKISMQKIK